CGPCNTRGLAAMGASMRLHLSPARGIGGPNGSPYAQPPDFPTSPLPHRVGDESGRATLITLPEQDEPRPPPTACGMPDHSSQKSLLAKLSEELGREEHFLEAAGNCRCTRMRVSSAADITTEVCDPADDLLQRQVTVGNWFFAPVFV